MFSLLTTSPVISVEKKILTIKASLMLHLTVNKNVQQRAHIMHISTKENWERGVCAFKTNIKRQELLSSQVLTHLIMYTCIKI